MSHMSRLLSFTSISSYLVILALTWIVCFAVLKKIGFSSRKINLWFFLAVIATFVGTWIGYVAIKHP